MREEILSSIRFLVTLLLGASAGCIIAGLHKPSGGPETVVVTQVDTLVIRDTITAYKPVPFNVYVVDTMWVPVTVHEHDTVWAQLPRTAKVYQDSTYRAVVSGFLPSLDTISVYQRTKVITVTNTVRTPAPRWSLGVQAGYGASKDGLTPYIGVGVSYRLLPLR